MKFHYRSILKEIDEAINGALLSGRTLESIEFTHAEYVEFKRELYKQGYAASPLGEWPRYNGVSITCESACDNVAV